MCKASKMRKYTKSFDKTKYTSFLIQDYKLLKNIIKSRIKTAKVLKRI